MDDELHKWFNEQFNASIKVGSPAFELLVQLYKHKNILMQFKDPIALLPVTVGFNEGDECGLVHVFKVIDKHLAWTEDFKYFMEKIPFKT